VALSPLRFVPATERLFRQRNDFSSPRRAGTLNRQISRAFPEIQGFNGDGTAVA
jgi:hypothetical protein